MRIPHLTRMNAHDQLEVRTCTEKLDQRLQPVELVAEKFDPCRSQKIRMSVGVGDSERSLFQSEQGSRIIPSVSSSFDQKRCP